MLYILPLNIGVITLIKIGSIAPNVPHYFTKAFNTHDISEGFVIYEKLSI